MPESTISAGIDVGGTFVKWVLVSGDQQVLEQGRQSLPDQQVLPHIIQLATTLKNKGARSVGVGVAGLVEWPEGVFVWGPHVSGRALSYRSVLTEQLQLPIVVDNDANLAAWAEYKLGAARSVEHALMLTFGTGIGAGLICDGQIYRGNNFAGEVGHLGLDPQGRLCACGRRGCWETFVSGSRLDAIARELASSAPDGALAQLVGDRPPTGADLSEAARQGDPAAGAALSETGVWLGRGVAALVTILDPEMVVVGGAVAQAGELLLKSARVTVGNVLGGSEYRPSVQLIQAELGPWAGAIGAALLSAEV